MAKHHPDAVVMRRIGTATIREHFEISKQAVHYWRFKGVPKQYRKALIALGESREIDMSDFAATRATPTSGDEPMSSAQPA
jgi:hypothetical protein